ncbi:MAG: hydroxyethylthiazole kinase [Myxococcota bacterium]
MTESLAGLGPALTRLRAGVPLVHNITNYVVMNNTANALLALGASPAMVHAPDEVEDFVRLSSALVVNIGTLSQPWVEAMKLAAEAAQAAEVPWVLDPVGVGATPFRTRVAAELLECRPAVVRGNASEILALVGATTDGPKGVDATAAVEDATVAAQAWARAAETVVVISGATDVITDGTRTVKLGDGDPMMTRVTGMGCTATALVGAFLAIEADPFRAAAYGMAVLGLAGRRAAGRAPGPGSLQGALLDALYALDPADLLPSVVA